MIRLCAKKKGMALPIVLIVGAVILFASLSLLDLVDNSMRIRKNSEDKMAAKYAVQAAAEHALYLYDIKVKQETLVDNFNYNTGEIKDDLGKLLGRYTIRYTAPLQNSYIGKFDIVGLAVNIKGFQSNSTIKAVLEINVQDGTIQKYEEY